MTFTIKNGDALELLKEIEDESIGCIVTDPPYNISNGKTNINRKSMDSQMLKRNSDIKLDFGEWDKRTEDDYYEFTKQWFTECARILKPKAWIYIFFSKERIGYFTDPRNGLFVTNGIYTKSIITWHKTNPTPSFRKMNYLSSTEFIAVGSKGNSRIPNFLEQKNMHNFFETANSSIYGETEHPTEKPIELLLWLLKTGGNSPVLDPFMGSGTTGTAALELDMDFIGFDTDEQYFSLAKERIKRTASQSRLIQYE